MVFKPKKKIQPVQEEVEEVEEEDEVADEIPEEEMQEIEEVKKAVNSGVTWSIQEVPTQTTQVIYNSKTKKAYDLTSAVVELLNRTE